MVVQIATRLDPVTDSKQDRSVQQPAAFDDSVSFSRSRGAVAGVRASDPRANSRSFDGSIGKQL